MTFFDDVGKMALGSRVRFLAEMISSDAAEIYRAYGNDLHPKWFPVFYVLAKGGDHSVVSVAQQIGHSHASVSKIVAEMARADLIVEKPDPADRRRTAISLSKTGVAVARKIQEQYADVNLAIEDISREATHDLWAALGEWETLLTKKSLKERVLAQKIKREANKVVIEPYQPKHQEAFRRLNEQWITTYFKMEKPDYDALDNPKRYILDRGGFIFVATINKTVVGVCALIKHEKLKTYELAKMAVAPEARGNNIGFLLGQAVIEKARALKTDRIFLESNTVLKPAIGLYKKLGFKKIVGPPTPYERCNIQMELWLSKTKK